MYKILSIISPSEQTDSRYIVDGVGSLEITLDRPVPQSFANLKQGASAGQGIAMDVFATSSTAVSVADTLIEPESKSTPQLVKVDFPVQNFRPLDFFLIRRYRESSNTILIANKFPYGSLKTEQRFVEADNVTTLFGGDPTSGGDTFASESISTTSQSGSYVTSIKPLSKKDNTPTGLLFPEFPTKKIEVDSDKIIEQLRDNKLIT